MRNRLFLNLFLSSFFAPPSRAWLLSTVATVGALMALDSWAHLSPVEVAVIRRDSSASRQVIRTAAASSAQSAGMVARAVSRFIGVLK